jgi:hypothetical protein
MSLVSIATTWKPCCFMWSTQALQQPHVGLLYTVTVGNAESTPAPATAVVGPALVTTAVVAPLAASSGSCGAHAAATVKTTSVAIVSDLGIDS